MQKEERLEEVIATDINVRPSVSEVAALPLTVLSSHDIAKQGPQEISTIRRDNPAFSGATLNDGSGGFFSGAVETLNLLGLGDKYTLVLFGGRLFNGMTSTNTANIPVGAIFCRSRWHGTAGKAGSRL